MEVEPFRIDVAEDVLEDLRARLRRTRWPDAIPGIGWEQGADLDYVRELVGHWAGAFDWRAREAELNRFAHFRAEVGGLGIHFVHERGRDPDSVPLVLTHGWPSSFLEFLPLVPLLTDPAGHGLPGRSFDVVIPSLPGYGFSDRPRRAGVTTRHTARLWHELMRGLGYERYGAQGADFGAGVSTFMALDDPEPMLGLHVTFLEVPPYVGPGSRAVSPVERAYLADAEAWAANEHAYADLQGTKPQTAGYGLNDSPAGLAAWLVEKWRSWSDSGGDVERRFGRDLLLTNMTIYWVTETITSSMRTYYDTRRHLPALGLDDVVAVPTAMAVFANEFVSEGRPPREWAERLYDIRRWTEMPRGGHFAALEEPELLARDVAAFFGDLPAR